MSIKRLGEGNLSRILGKIKTALDGKSDTNHTHSNYLTSANVASVVEADNNSPVSSAAVNTALNNVGGLMQTVVYSATHIINADDIGKIVIMTSGHALLTNSLSNVPIGSYFIVASNKNESLLRVSTPAYAYGTYEYSKTGNSTSVIYGNRSVMVIYIGNNKWVMN